MIKSKIDKVKNVYIQIKVFLILERNTRLYRRYMDNYSGYDCGTGLATYINSKMYSLKRKINKNWDILKKLNFEVKEYWYL